MIIFTIPPILQSILIAQPRFMMRYIYQKKDKTVISEKSVGCVF